MRTKKPAIKKIISIKKQLILMFFAFFSVIFLALAFVQDYAISHHLTQQDYNYLNNKFNTVTDEERQQPLHLISVLADEPIYLWLLDNNKVADTNTSLKLPQQIMAAPANLSSQHVFNWQIDRLHVRAFRFKVNEKYSIVMGLKINHHLDFLSHLRTILFGSLGVTFLLLSVYSLVIINKGLRPLSKFHNHIRKVTPNRLGIRVDTQTLPNEIHTLVSTHNQMLDRLEAGFVQLSDFSSDIAHELRTPLTNIITQNQVILTEPRNTLEYKDTIESNLEELHRIVKTINDVLYIAKAENALIHRHDETINLYDEAQQIVEYYSILGDERGITIAVKGHASLVVDKNMFMRALSNLVANAVRHAYDNTLITVELIQSDHVVQVKVSNTGDDIEASQLEHLFERFYRADKSRQHTATVGAGLGLSITQSIVHAYGGEIEVKSNHNITEFILHFKVNS